MSLGTLRAKAVLDKPSHLYCGSSEPITGRVCLWYEPGKGLPADHELFGPLRISVIFHGRLKTKILDTNHVHRGRVPLFSKTKEIFNGSIRITKGDCQGQRFELTLPERIETKALHAWDEDDARFDLDLRQTLPPSTKTSSTRFNNRFNAFVEYKLSLRVTMPDMRVKIVVPEPAYEPSIRYEQPRVSRRVRARRLEFRGEFSIPQTSLEPEAGAPAAPAKKRLGIFPPGKTIGCIYDWAYSVPTHIHRSEYTRIKVAVKPREGSFSPDITPPGVTVKDYTVKLVSVVHARAPTHIISSPHAVTTTCVSSTSSSSPSSSPSSPSSSSSSANPTHGSAAQPPPPALSEPFGPSNAWTHYLDLPGTAHVSSSFRTISIRQVHRLEISMTLAVAGQTAHIQKTLGVTIHAPLELPSDIMEDLPVYHEIAAEGEDVIMAVGPATQQEEEEEGLNDEDAYGDRDGDGDQLPPAYASHAEWRFTPVEGLLPPPGEPEAIDLPAAMAAAPPIAAAA
ncbi:uncharacterized protein B0I36DRAFT_363666 [Microdochium trichocladiopsis]|uniref:Uncharacterized protein n=1 Tax=Microdochium trichocladiopsis TaxID=1682393 RepID=A0A9P8Y473_9PEZI|nr:uncharacterized protein B0I36DRAFT_363666 [Microdochium trichocladiopsis]KAH7029074.1 hypothetical protein B0I36DRAFT_363666 [Microdochium trichocladiopsis]